ncbi:MAG: hypothetical protein NTX50_04235 [Candidatus Sumerlaeota bacterium]|nr:hypothetical protein [Candidatus Sumerlaeota bacterium]
MPFLEYKEPLKKLVQDHRKIKHEPLLLAVYFSPKPKVEDIYLFEVADRFRGNVVSNDRQMLEIGYASTPGFPMRADQRLHLILTNPEEMETALRENWKIIRQLRKSKQTNDFKVLHRSKRGASFLERI